MREAIESGSILVKEGTLFQRAYSWRVNRITPDGARSKDWTDSRSTEKPMPRDGHFST